MPELPEVESLRLKLAPKILNAIFQSVTLKRADLRYPMPKDVSKRLSGHRVTGLRRRSKYLLMDFDNGLTLVVHLGMSGRFFFAERKLDLDKHDHVLIDLKDGRHLRFRDPRRFGMLFLCETKKLDQNKFFKNLGVEPLSEDFNSELLFRLCKKSSAPIKSLLMNANRIVGVGNIYANEALFLSGIRPTRPSSKITQIEAKTLTQNIKHILSESIKVGGTTFRDYVDADQKPGLYKLDLFVYGREGEKCRRCQTTIKRITQTGRSSFFCPHCQK